jgi:hypothetical protein
MQYISEVSISEGSVSLAFHGPEGPMSKIRINFGLNLFRCCSEIFESDSLRILSVKNILKNSVNPLFIFETCGGMPAIETIKLSN